MEAYIDHQANERRRIQALDDQDEQQRAVRVQALRASNAPNSNPNPNTNTIMCIAAGTKMVGLYSTTLAWAQTIQRNAGTSNSARAAQANAGSSVGCPAGGASAQGYLTYGTIDNLNEVTIAILGNAQRAPQILRGPRQFAFHAVETYE
ncbi:hypothetical protein MMC30_003081 [Trapelia coarctata]|nr:hypothetical protein [Trapelia coarctata]